MDVRGPGHVPGCLTTAGNNLCYPSIGDWVGPKVGLNFVEKRKTVATYWDSNSDRPVRGLIAILTWLRNKYICTNLCIKQSIGVVAAETVPHFLQPFYLSLSLSVCTHMSLMRYLLWAAA